METYGKTALVDDVAANVTGITRRQVDEVVSTMLGLIQNKVKAGTRVTLTGFGTFQQVRRAARVGTNIQTKQKINIPAQTGVRFTVGSEFKAAVSGRSAPKRTSPGYAKERAVSGRNK